MTTKDKRSNLTPTRPPGEVSGGDDPQWLQEFGQSKEAARLATIAADEALINDLRLGGFTNSDKGWQLLASALAEYGYQVLITWIRRGLIFLRIAERPTLALYMKKHPRFRDIREVDAETLAIDTVGEAIIAFRRDVLIPGVWDPRKGASLKTFFIGQCLYQFVSVYGEWAEQEAERQKWVAEVDLARESNPDDPEVSTIRRAVLDEARAARDPVTMSILDLQTRGYQQDEIAEVLQLSIGQVEGRLYRHRRNLRTAGSRPNASD